MKNYMGIIRGLYVKDIEHGLNESNGLAVHGN